MSVAPAQRQRLYETVVENVLAYIEEKRLRPGEALPPERELAQAMNVSRNVLRQGFSILEERGLVVTRQGSGRYLREITASAALTDDLAPGLEIASIADILEARTLLEVEVVALACERRTREEAMELTHMAVVLTSWSDNVKFHTAIARASHNFMLERLVREQAQLLGDLRQRDYYRWSRRAVDEHVEIAGAILSRNKDQARRLMQVHFRETRGAIFGPDRADTSEDRGASVVQAVSRLPIE